MKLTHVLTLSLQQRLDPLLMLDAFGSDAAAAYTGGFPDHPLRGFETVTIMLEGRMRHLPASPRRRVCCSSRPARSGNRSPSTARS